MLITGNIIDGKTFKSVIDEMADQAIQAVIKDGTAPKDAERTRPCLASRHGLARIMTPELWFINLSSWCEETQFFLDPILGYFRVEAQNRPHYDIVLRETEDQRLYLAVVRRTGPASPDNPKPDLFWSLNLIVPQVEGDDTPALCLGMDITNNTRAYGCEFSSNLYRQPRFDQQTRQWIPRDALRTLDMPINIEQACAGALKAAGFPLHEIRQNRPSPEELRERNRERRWGQSSASNAPSAPSVSSAPSLVPSSAPVGNGGTPYASSVVANGNNAPYAPAAAGS